MNIRSTLAIKGLTTAQRDWLECLEAVAEQGLLSIEVDSGIKLHSLFLSLRHSSGYYERYTLFPDGTRNYEQSGFIQLEGGAA